MHPFNQEPKKIKRDPGSATSRTGAEAPHYDYRSLAGQDDFLEGTKVRTLNSDFFFTMSPRSGEYFEHVIDKPGILGNILG